MDIIITLSLSKWPVCSLSFRRTALIVFISRCFRIPFSARCVRHCSFSYNLTLCLKDTFSLSSPPYRRVPAYSHVSFLPLSLSPVLSALSQTGFSCPLPLPHTHTHTCQMLCGVSLISRRHQSLLGSTTCSAMQWSYRQNHENEREAIV